MHSRPRWPVVLVLALGVAPASIAGCRSKPDAAPMVPPSAALKASAPVVVSASVVVAPARTAVPAVSLTPAQRQLVAAAVTKGRQHAQEKRWADAVASFETALAVTPADGHTLSDLAFAALQAGDLDKAQAATVRALTFVHEPSLRGQILYNHGRVFEARGDKDKAAASYRESLGLRENEIVQKRLSSLDRPNPAPPKDPLPCNRSFPTQETLCACLVAVAKEERPHLQDVETICEQEKPRSKSGDLFIIKAGQDTIGQRTHFVVAKRSGAFRLLAAVGEDFEPGAFGVHNEAEVKSFEERVVDGKTLWIVRWEQRNSDSNMAGLEQYADTTEHATFCVPPDLETSGRCAVTIALSTHASLSYPDFAELDEETRQLIKDRKTSAYDRKTTVSFVIEAGAVKTKLENGTAKDLPPKTIGTHRL